MPIQITCTTCGKRLQVGDQHAGKRVACPGCKTVLTAPGTAAPAASPPPPAAPKPAAPAAKPASAAVKPAPAKPAAPPPSAPIEEPAPSVPDEDFSFGSARKKDDDEEDEPKPKAKEREKDAGKVKKPAPKAKKKLDDDDDDEMPRKKQAAREADSDEEVKRSAKAWGSFGGGSALCRWGIWLVFLALAYGLGLFGYISIGLVEDPYGTAEAIQALGGPFIFVPFYGINFVGVLLTFMGRTRLLSIPSGTGVKKVFFGAWLFTLVWFLSAVAGLAFSIMFGMEASELRNSAGMRSSPGDYFAFAVLAYGIGLPFWALSDLSIIPAFAVVGGSIPSLRLRRRVGSLTFGLQLLIVLEIVVGIGGGFLIRDMEKRRDRYEPPAISSSTKGGFPTTTVTVRPSRGSSGAEQEKQVTIVVLAVLLLAHLIYTGLFASLYGAGRAAVTAAREAEEAAEDEEIGS